jgi:hypothetical protein
VWFYFQVLYSFYWSSWLFLCQNHALLYYSSVIYINIYIYMHIYVYIHILTFIYFCCCFLVRQEFELRILALQNKNFSSWAMHPRSFLSGYFEDIVSQTICLGWPWTVVLPISASQVAKMTDMNHRCLAIQLFEVKYQSLIL